MIGEKTLFSLLAVAVIVSGIGIGFVVSHPNMTASNAPKNDTGDYHLTLVITTNNFFNNQQGYQPAFFVMSNGSLESSANIVLPANTLIEVTIICYDDGAAYTAPQYANVTGTVNSQETIINNTMVNATQGNNGIGVVGAWTTSSVDASNIAHTFTVTGIGLNVPVLPSSVEQFSFITTGAGTYVWQCEAACGTGPSGWGGAMSTPGWMTGTVTIQ